MSMIDSRSAVALVTLDISASFDPVNHDILLWRLNNDFGIKRLPLQWIGSYIIGRTFCIHIGTSSSGIVQTSTGIPQGSVLGPILFTAYVSPISRLLDSYGIKYHKYADDTQLYTTLLVPINSRLQMLEACMSNLQHWYWCNERPVAQLRLIWACFFRMRQRYTSSINCFCCLVQYRSVWKVEDCWSNIRPNSIIWESYQHDCLLVQFSHTGAVPHSVLTLSWRCDTIECSIVNTHLDYCNSLLYGVAETHLNKLHHIENKLARVVCDVGNRDDNTIDLLWTCTGCLFAAE